MESSGGPVELPNTLLDIRENYERICLEEEVVNQRLEALLARGPDVGARLSNLKKFHSAFHLIEGDAKQLCSMTAFTSSLAESVSAKVRRLDVLKNRVSDCQRRVEDLLDLQYCTEGVQTALQNEDFEKAAGHIHRFLSLDETALIGDGRATEGNYQDGSSLRDAFKTLHESKSKLREIISSQFDAAVNEDDVASVERFFKIFPLLNMHDEGLKKFSEYLRRKLRDAWQKAQRTGKDEPKRANVKFADLLTVLLEETARVVEVHQPLVETYYGPGRLLCVLSELQKECDSHFAEVIDSFRRGRNFGAMMAKAKTWLGKMAVADGRARRRGHQSSTDKLDPKATDALLGEMALFNARVALYTKFVRKRCWTDIELGFEDEAARAQETAKLELMIRDSRATRCMQEILGDYIALEEYYLRESIGKAVQVHSANLSAAAPGTIRDLAVETVKTVSSPLVDDVFFIFQKCVRRAVSTGNVDGFCAVMNIGCAVMEEEFCTMLRNALKQNFPTGYLDLSQAYNVLQSSIQQGKLQSAPDTETAKMAFLMHLNHAEMSVEYAESLKKKLTQEISASEVGLALTQKDQVKVDNSTGQLQTLVDQFRGLMDLGMDQVKSAVIQPRIRPWVEGFISTSHNITDEEFADYEANDPFVHSFIMNLDGLLTSFKPSMTPGNYENLVIVLTIEVTTQLEKAVMKKAFNRLGGLQLDKEVRALVAYLSSMCTWGVREKFSRLSQMATLLNMERLSEVSEFWSSTPDSLVRLMSASQVKQVLELREDFKPEEVRRLVL